MLAWDEYVFINPDLTIYIEREPVGEWICLEARTTRSATAASDSPRRSSTTRSGRVGRSLQSLYASPGGERRRPAGARLLEAERLDAHVVLLRVAAVDAVGERLDDRQQRRVRADERGVFDE